MIPYLDNNPSDQPTKVVTIKAARLRSASKLLSTEKLGYNLSKLICIFPVDVSFSILASSITQSPRLNYHVYSCKLYCATVGDMTHSPGLRVNIFTFAVVLDKKALALQASLVQKVCQHRVHMQVRNDTCIPAADNVACGWKVRDTINEKRFQHELQGGNFAEDFLLSSPFSSNMQMIN